MVNLFSLEGKKAWITGGCYGIGYAIAKAYARAGAANIIFNCRSGQARDRALADYAADGIANVHGYVCDVTDEEAVRPFPHMQRQKADSRCSPATSAPSMENTTYSATASVPATSPHPRRRRCARRRRTEAVNNGRGKGRRGQK